MTEDESPENLPEGGNSFIEFMGGQGNRGCACSLGCSQLILLAILVAIAGYLIVTRFIL